MLVLSLTTASHSVRYGRIVGIEDVLKGYSGLSTVHRSPGGISEVKYLRKSAYSFFYLLKAISKHDASMSISEALNFELTAGLLKEKEGIPT